MGFVIKITCVPKVDPDKSGQAFGNKGLEKQEPYVSSGFQLPLE
jgi:hypothetical protein